VISSPPPSVDLGRLRLEGLLDAVDDRERRLELGQAVISTWSNAVSALETGEEFTSRRSACCV
jgi:hypothetical protein